MRIENTRFDGKKGTAFLAKLRELVRSKEGVGAVEFALIFPIFAIIYLVALELTIGFSTVRKVARSASVTADLVTQQESVDTAYLDTMLDVAESIVAPYSTDGMKIVLTGITIDANAEPTVLWSWDSDGGTPYASGSQVSVPDELEIASSFLVHAEASIPYEFITYLPGLTDSSTTTINIERDYYFRQRKDDNVACTDC